MKKFSITILAIALVFGLTLAGCDNGTTGGNSPSGSTSGNIGTGSTASRRYRVEVYNINSATYDYLSNIYGGKTLQDVTRADVVSKSQTSRISSDTNQTLSGVTSILSSTGNSIGFSSSMITEMTDGLTTVLQTQNGQSIWMKSGSTSNYRYFYVNRTSSGNYTVEVYNISSATYDYLSKTYGGKTLQDVTRADAVSRSQTSRISSDTNQTLSGVISILSSTANSIGFSSSMITEMTDGLTTVLQTHSGQSIWMKSGSISAYRYFYVSQQ